MVEIPVTVTIALKQFLEQVQQLHHVQAAYLYGSYAKGQATTWSDIDIAIISPDFADNLSQARVALLCLAAKTDARIEPAPFAPDDFIPDDPLVSEIQRTGLALPLPA